MPIKRVTKTIHNVIINERNSNNRIYSIENFVNPDTKKLIEQRKLFVNFTNNDPLSISIESIFGVVTDIRFDNNHVLIDFDVLDTIGGKFYLEMENHLMIIPSGMGIVTKDGYLKDYKLIGFICYGPNPITP